MCLVSEVLPVPQVLVLVLVAVVVWHQLEQVEQTAAMVQLVL